MGERVWGPQRREEESVGRARGQHLFLLTNVDEEILHTAGAGERRRRRRTRAPFFARGRCARALPLFFAAVHACELS